MSEHHHSARPGRALVVFLVASVLLWQVLQALILGSFGVPGVIEFPIAGMGKGLRSIGAGGISVVRKGLPGGRANESRPKSGAPGGAGSPETAALKPDQAPRIESVPSSIPMEGWIRAQAREFVGGMDDAGNMLYRFDVWLKAPASEKERIATVDYTFDAPSAKPPKQTSKDAKSDFRVSFGGLTCATAIEFVVTFFDGEKRKAKVDGCEVLN